MDFIDKIKTLSQKISQQLNLIQTEEATKNAFIMPLISTLGYDVFDPTEVTPELIADIGTKKGEKVDYAILIEGKPMIIFECKKPKSDLTMEHVSQLYRYYNATEAKFAVLTNGIEYRFYSDLVQTNKMDADPFLKFSLLDIKEQEVNELKKFRKEVFDIQSLLATATELKYRNEIKKYLKAELISPSEDFVKFFTAKVYTGKVTQNIKSQFTEITKKAFAEFLYDYLSERIKPVLETPMEEATTPATAESSPLKIMTTEEEVIGHQQIQTILKEIVPAERVVMKDTINYCGILFDGNNRKPICRLYFNNSKKKYLALFDENKNENKVLLNEVEDIIDYKEQIKAVVHYYLANEASS